MIPLFIIVAAASVLVVATFSYAFVRHYVDKREGSCLTTFAVVMGLSISLWCVFLIPLDIYTISSDLDAEGAQVDVETADHMTHVVQYLLMGMYGLLILFAFVIMPFAYFYYEEEEDVFVKRCGQASSYTGGFLLVFVVLLVMGVVLRKDRITNEENGEWQNALAGEFTNIEAMLAFCVCGLASLGFAGWDVYGGYGLATFPLSIIWNYKTAESSSAVGNLQNLDVSLMKLRDDMRFIESRYSLSGNPWSRADKTKYERLQRDEKKLLGAQSQMPVDDGIDCWAKCWNCMQPLRLIVGFFFMALSLLIVSSMVIGTIDRYENSDCRWSCGFTLTNPNIFNPLDEALNLASKIFPFDFILFGLIVVYIMVCAIKGLVTLGVRICCYKMYNLVPSRSQPNAMIFGTWLLMMVVLTLNLEIITVTPRYVTFGQQFYYEFNVTNHTKNVSQLLDLPLETDSLEPLAHGMPDTKANAQAPLTDEWEQMSRDVRRKLLSLDPVNDYEDKETQELGLNPEVFEEEDDGEDIIEVLWDKDDFPLYLNSNDTWIVYRMQDCPSNVSNASWYITCDKSEKHFCTVVEGPAFDKVGLCRSSQIASFIHNINVQFPFFGSILFVANMGFLAVFPIALLMGLCRNRDNDDDEYVQMKAEADIWRDD